MWERMAWCESRNTWDVDTGNGYYGGLQFALGSWQWMGGEGNPLMQRGRADLSGKFAMASTRMEWMAGVQSVFRLVQMADIAMTLSINEIQRLLEGASIAPKKSLGQNFVIDPNTVRKIARLAGVGEGSRVLEIGAGLGSLTLALAETGARVTAIETDRALIRSFKHSRSERNVIEAARELAWSDVVSTPGWNLVANLPYNIATSLVLTVLDEVPNMEPLLVMVQQEAGNE